MKNEFMFVRYPEASGPKSIMKHLESFFIFHHSYDISDLLKESYSLVVIPGELPKNKQKTWALKVCPSLKSLFLMVVLIWEFVLEDIWHVLQS